MADYVRIIGERQTGRGDNGYEPEVNKCRDMMVQMGFEVEISHIVKPFTWRQRGTLRDMLMGGESILPKNSNTNRLLNGKPRETVEDKTRQ